MFFTTLNMTFGFGTSHTEQSELEKKLGTKFVEPDKDKYNFYRGRWVEIGYANTGRIGQYQGLTSNGDVVLLPVLDRQRWPKSIICNKDEQFDFYFLDDENPVLINMNSIYSISGENKCQLDKVIELSKKIRRELENKENTQIQ